MKIAIFSDNFYPEISGISDSVIKLGEHLAQRGHEIHYFAAKYSAKDFAKANLPNQELDMGSNVHFHRFWSLPMLGSPTGQSRIVIPFGLRLLKYKKEKFDIVYTQSPYGLGMEAYFMSRMFGIPLVGTNHTPITEFTSYLPLSNKFFDWLGLKFVSWYYNRCVFVTAPNVGILKEMKSNGLKTPSRTISNPIDLQNFFPVSPEQKNELKKKFELSDLTVHYAGRIAPEKHVDVIIRAMVEVTKKFSEAMLAIAGLGSAEDDLKKLTAKFGLEKNVKFFGRVSDEMHAELFQASEVFAVMSTAEMQCISLMKAMATGLPVLGADAWALPEYINADCGFVIPVGDVKTLAEKIIMLFENEELRQKLGQGGIEYVKQFSAEHVARKWEDIYKKVKQEHASK